MQNLQELLKILIHSPVDFVVIGGFAAVLHGCNQTTRDIDICILYSPDQIKLLKDTLRPFNPRYRTAENKLSFLESAEEPTQEDFHLVTDLGVLDVIRQVKGVGDYYSVLKNSEEIPLYNGKCRLISIDDLIKCKKSLGRHRDLLTVMELENIKKEALK